MAASEVLAGAPVVAPVLDLPAAARATLVNEARATLLRSATVVTIAQLAEATGRSAEAARKWADRKSTLGRLVVVDLDDGTTLIPTIQLDEPFTLDEQVAERTRRLVTRGWGCGPSGTGGRPRKDGSTTAGPQPVAAQRGSAHVHIATTQIGPLLESALHDATPPHRGIQVPTLTAWSGSIVELRHDLRLFDLRDPELDRLGIGRDRLTSTPPVHYACIRRWVSHLVGRHVGGQQAHGIVWPSRQAELHARAKEHRPAFVEDLLGLLRIVADPG